LVGFRRIEIREIGFSWVRGICGGVGNYRWVSVGQRVSMGNQSGIELVES